MERSDDGQRTGGSVSVVVPMYRTRRFLPELLSRLGSALPSGSEVVLVDDACPEQSWREAVDARVDSLRIEVVRLTQNVGQHAAVLVGLACASGDTVVVMDADLQDSPEAIPVLLERLEQDDAAEAVCAARLGQYTSNGRRRTAMLYRALARALSGGRLPPNAGMFLVVRRVATQRVLALDDPFVPLVPALARTGSSIVAIPVGRRPRLGDASAYTAVMRARVAARGLLTLTPLHPLVAARHRRRWASNGATAERCTPNHTSTTDRNR